MNRAASQANSFRATVCALAVGAALACTVACGGVEVSGEYPAGYSDNGYPPDAYIATTEPVYFVGHAAYGYGGFWYYRDGGRRSRYGHEPPGLYQRRIHAAPGRRNYEPSRGRSPGRSGTTGGRR
jgi:hypothetical protein